MATGNNQPAPPAMTTDALILQVLRQLEQQQLVTNELIRNQQQSNEQQRAFIQQQQNALRNIQVKVPANPEMILDSLASNVKEFRYDTESTVTFSSWFSRYEELFSKDAARLDDPAKVRLLMRKLGIAEHERYSSFILPKTSKDFTFDETVTKLKALFGAAESLISKRYRCLQIAKSSTEDFVTYTCRVNKTCVEFDLKKLSEEQFKVLIFVCGLTSEVDAEMRTRLLSRIEEKSEITLEELSAECQRLLNLRHDAAMIEGSSTSVNAIKQRFQKHSRPWKQTANSSSSSWNQSTNSSSSSSSAENKKKVPPSPCWKCGSMHYVRDCRFKDHKCSVCKQSGHKEGYCDSDKKSNKKRTKRQLRNVTVDTKTVQVSVNNVRGRRKFVPVFLNGVAVRLQFDSASDITVVSSATWKQLGQPPTRPPSVNAKTASGDPLNLQSEFDCSITVNDVTLEGTVYVVAQDLHILGLDLVEKFQLDAVPMNVFCRQVNNSSSSMVERLKTAYPQVFSTSLGRCTKTTVKLDLKPGQRPVFRPKRPVAYAMYQAVDEELDRLERLEIISPTDYSDWAAPIVVVRKASGAIRICGDYSTGLNDALQPHQYPLPLPQDIFVKLANCKVFSIVDMSESYLQVGVDETTSTLLTINTHRGLYKVNRLAPGVKAAPGAFQQLVDTMLAGLKQTCGYIDDVIVGGENEEEHWHNLNALFQRLQEFGFTVRLEKCSFGRQQIKYLGHLVDQHGIRPDPAKVEAIKLMPAPTDVSEVRSFLGAINFYGKFVPNMRALRSPLDDLLKTGAKFVWTAQCQRAFDEFKTILSSDLLLTHYNPKMDIIVSADASSVGVGATISHRFPDGSVKVVQHASRSLAPAERNYSQTDREGLAIIFAVTKFHRMIFGRKFLLQTDHQPLLRIFGSKKGIPVYTANRLQRWALTLLSYDFTMQYVATEKFGNADILSRLISRHVKPDEDFVIASVTLESDMRSVVHDTFNVFPLSFKTVQDSTKSDPVLKKVYRYIQDGWPKSLASNADRELLRFHNRRESLSTVQGCILFGERLVIPAPLRKRCLEELHRGHPGIQRMKALSRSYVYWPTLDNEVADYVRTCSPCALTAKSPAAATPVPWPKSVRPWQRVHIDYAGPIDGDYYLLAVDSFSKWPEIIRTSRITTAATIGILRSIFARFGMPETLVSDNGTQFTSLYFAHFCSTNGIDHVTTAPFHPQSNGQAERFVDTFKRAIKKIEEGRGSTAEVLDTFLLAYRSTPNRSAHEGLSPSEIMFGRRIRTCLELLRPPTEHPPPEAVPVDQKSSMRSFNASDLVYVKIYTKNAWNWVPGKIIERVGQVMFNVLTENGRLVRSHLNQLKSRATSGLDHDPGAGTSGHKQLPLDVLLDAWNLLPTNGSSSDATTRTADASDIVRTPSLSPPTGPAYNSDQSALSSSSRATTSSSFESAAASTPTVQRFIPRRSSRPRRPPARFDAYRRF